MFMSTISLKFGVHTRNWPRIDFKPLEFNFEFYFWRCPGGGGGGKLGLYIKLKTCSGSQKNHSK